MVTVLTFYEKMREFDNISHLNTCTLLAITIFLQNLSTCNLHNFIQFVQYSVTDY